MSRRQKFEDGERSKLLALPILAYTFGEWKTTKVHPDCHVQIGKRGLDQGSGDTFNNFFSIDDFVW